MEVQILEDQGLITNYDDLLRIFGDMQGRYITADDLQEVLQRGFMVFYFNENSVKHTDISMSEDGAALKLIKTGERDIRTGYPICFSFTRGVDKLWRGCFVGTQYSLHKKWLNSNFCPIKLETPKESLSAFIETNMQEIYTSLFYKEKWLSAGSYSRLELYLYAVKRKIESEYKRKNETYLLFNKTRTKVIFNSRLLNCFGGYVYLVASFSAGTLGNVALVKGVHTQREHGFDTGIIDVPPVQFFKSLDEVIFNAQLHEMDLTNMFSLNHIINERRFRFPEEIQKKSVIEIANALKTAVEHGVKMAQIDYKFVVPMYNIEYERIQFLMPIYFTFNETERPELALVIEKQNGYWSIKTILTIEDAYHNARVISNPDVKWLYLQ